MKDITTNKTILSALVTIASVSMIAGCALYQMLRNRLSTVSLYALSSVLMCILLPAMIIGKHPLVFCTIYFLVGIPFNIINIAGAVYITEFIGFEDIGTYTSIRLIVMTAATSVSGAVIGMLIDKIPSVWILLVCGVCQLISGILYYLWEIRFRDK